jgi:hypothetical protein
MPSAHLLRGPSSALMPSPSAKIPQKRSSLAFQLSHGIV